jgi:hypothetical protein
MLRFPISELPTSTSGEFEAQAAALLRSHDRIWTDQGSVYILLPESTTVSGRAVLERLQRTLDMASSVGSVVCFPEDAYTSEALLATLHGYRILHRLRFPDDGLPGRRGHDRRNAEEAQGDQAKVS